MNNALLIEIPKKDYNLSELKDFFCEKDFLVVYPKNFEGTDIVNIIIEISKITIPALITYLISKRNTIQVSYTNDKIRIDIQTALNNKKIINSQCYEKLDNIFAVILRELEEESNED